MIAGEPVRPSIQIFIGAPIEHQSEFDCLTQIYGALSKRLGWAIIFANFHVGERQIDFAIFTGSSTIVIEAKHYSKPVTGGQNGLWEQVGANGVRKMGNAYDQALGAKNALRDALPGDVKGYPNALVLITPKIPNGSRLPSDFKVTTTGIEQAVIELAKASGALLTRLQCEAFAQQLRMEEVSNISAALDERVLGAARSHRAYSDAFRALHEPASNELIGDVYSASEGLLSLSDVEEFIHSQELATLIVGPSGCGKSLLLTSCAVASLKKKYTPLFVEAKNFEGSFQRFLDKEVSLLSTLSARDLVHASKLINSPLVLFLDGYNECPQNSKLGLTRSLRAFALRHDAYIVISTQYELVRSDLLKSRTVNVNRPSIELKAKLSKSNGLSGSFENLHHLLNVASSGLEASLVGKVRGLLAPGSSKFQVFDTFARFKLGTSANEGVRVLSALAETLVTRVCFSLSMREFDRICDATNLTSHGRQRLLESGLLTIRGDRVSFIHELFFAVYSAEAALRSVQGDLKQVCLMLTLPRLESSRTLIVGAIEDENLLNLVLENTDDQAILAASARGECGAIAQGITRRRISHLLTSMAAEAGAIRFRFLDDDWHAVEVIVPPPDEENAAFSSYLAAIADGLVNGEYLEDVMSAIDAVDNSITEFIAANVVEARLKKVAIRHEVFASAYVMSNRASIAKLINLSHSGGLTFRRTEGTGLASAIRAVWGTATSNGQFYFLLGLSRLSDFRVEAAPYVARLLKRVKTLPYHLQLAVFDSSQYLGGAVEPYRSEIIGSLKEALDKHGVMLNTVIFEALSRLHALDEDEQNHVPAIREEIRVALDNDSPMTDAAAWAIFSCQFDHPFDSAYWDEVQALDSSRKKLLLTKACRGADPRYVSFLGILIRELAEFNEVDSAAVIERWACLPAKDSVMPQDAVEVFVNAHEALGRLNAKLPVTTASPTDEADLALLACGELFYWANFPGLGVPEISKFTYSATTTLLERCQQTAAAALQLTTSWMLSADGTRYSLVRYYPQLCAAISRIALEGQSSQVSYFDRGLRSDPKSIAIFAVHLLGETGCIDDLQLLRSLCDDAHLGTVAIAAVRAIEDRRRTSNVS
jgi:hypothetical protein